MKVFLEVADGVHQGKRIPLTTPQFLIGRDPQCQLRPASPAISKQHCVVLVQPTQVVIRDFGSTNGTFVNDEPVQGDQVLQPGDVLKAGPLVFVVHIEGEPAQAPAASPVASPVATSDAEQVDLGVESGTNSDPESDKMAAILLGMEDDDAASSEPREEDIPEGSTVFDLPAVNAETQVDGAKKPDPKQEKLDNSSTAGEILRQYMRRPRT